MKLVRFGAPGKEQPGILEDDKIYDVSQFTDDFNEDFFNARGIDELKSWFDNNKQSLTQVPEGTRLGPPVSRPGKIICIGLNYSKHAAESGMDVPKEPVIFFKASSSVTGPFDNIVIPKNSEKTDWEVEVGVVIGKKASYVDEQSAMDYVAGYVLHNDVSERDFQLHRGGQWVKGKSCDTFAPLGPYLTTKDEVKDPHNLKVWLKVNGETMQDGNTNDLIFGIPKLVSYLSQFMSLLPGDIISTGTPEGVGLGLKPPRFLRPGDVVELGAEHLGTARQNVIACQS